MSEDDKKDEEKSIKVTKKTAKSRKSATKSLKNDGKLTKLSNFPVIPVRDIVIFPGTIVSLFIGRASSIKAANFVIKGDRKIVFVTQKDPDIDSVSIKDLYNIGVIGNVVQFILLPDNTIKLLIEASERVKISNYYMKDFITCDGEIIQEELLEEDRQEAYIRSLVKLYKEYVSVNKKVSQDQMKSISAATSISKSIDILISLIPIEEKKKIKFLEECDVIKRLEMTNELLIKETKILQEEKEFQTKVRGQMEKNQRDYYLHEQMKLIKKELGEADDVDEIADKYEQMMASNKNLSKEAIENIKSEIGKLRNTSNTSSEFGVIKSYLDTIFELPWKVFTKDEDNLQKAEEKLSESHYGMEKIKERIVEHIAVQQNIKKPTGVVICLHGAPGVGKTTLARSIAKAMNREYVKISLGGLHDPSELFGHRKTYIGAMPGKIINAMKKAKVSNPLILLDEIDKMSSDYRGDPASVMLEILDPEQNKEFMDHYLDIGYDISNVFFIATANSLNFAQPLRDRMELIHVPSYLEREKVIIAKNYLIPNKFKECGLDSKKVDFKEQAIQYILDKYTREAGVRDLERCIFKIARKNVVKLMKDQKNEDFELKVSEDKPKKKGKTKKDTEIVLKYDKISIDKAIVREMLGVEKFSHSELESRNMTGVVNGLAYTSVGGDVLLIEGVLVKGKGEIKFTGSLGDVMKESIQMGFSYIKANIEKFVIKKDISKFDVHIHAPEGATPKDGPSAGVTICTAIVSLLTDTKIRSDVAMTGEITLRGKVLAIGGLREKLTSAVRSKQITEVAIPIANMKDLEDVPQEIRDSLKINPCDTLDDVIEVAFCKAESSEKIDKKNIILKGKKEELSIKKEKKKAKGKELF